MKTAKLIVEIALAIPVAMVAAPVALLALLFHDSAKPVDVTSWPVVPYDPRLGSTE